MHPELYEIHKINPLTEITEINDKKASALTDDEIYKFFEDKKLKINFNIEMKKKIEFVKKDYEGLNVLVNFEIREIDKIDSKLSRYNVNFLHTLVWSDNRLAKLAREVFEEAKNINKKITEEDTFFCSFSEQQFIELGIYSPDIIMANAVSIEGDATEIIFEFEFYPSYFDKENYKYEDFLEIRKEIDGIGTFKGNFDFKSFSFDAQKILFNFQVNQNQLSKTHRIMPYITSYTVEELKRGFNNLKMQEWKKTA